MKKVLLIACLSACVNMISLSHAKAQGSPSIGQNLITNGDFSKRYVGWTHGHAYTLFTLSSGKNSVPGNIYVGIDQNKFNPGFPYFPDHSPSSDNYMLMVDGVCTPGVNLWSQSGIPIVANTNYYFSVWIASLIAGVGIEPGKLKFNINGVNYTNITAPATTSGWIEFTTVWNSGPTPTATATIQIQNTNTSGCGSGVDFAIDDISFTIGRGNRFAITGNINSSDSRKSVSEVGLLLINEKGEVIQKMKTSKEGNFAFRKLQSNNYQVIFEDPDPSMKAKMNISIEDSQLNISGSDLSKYNPATGKVERLAGKDQISIAGIVNSSNDKKDKEKITILLLDKEGNVVGRVETNKEGFFSFKHLSPDNYQILLEDIDPSLKVKFQVFEDDSSQSGFKTDSMVAIVYFDLNQSNLSNEAMSNLDMFIQYFKSHPAIRQVNLNAYGDASGTIEYNILLTQTRGETVLKYLTAGGLSKEKFKINAFGKSLAVKNSISDPKLNRKVDIVILE